MTNAEKEKKNLHDKGVTNAKAVANKCPKLIQLKDKPFH